MAFPPTHRPTLWAAAGYLAIVAVLFHRLLLGEVLSPAANLWDDVPFFSEAREDLSPYYNGIQGDVWRTFEPWHIYQYRSVREGRFPLWNPHVFCGFPFHANAISGTLSPLQSPYYVIDPKWAAGPVAAVVLWLAGFGAYCLGRRLGMVPVGAFVAGAAWMLCAFNVRWLLWPIAGIGAWLPLLLLALDGVIERVSLRRLALAGLAATGFQLTGHPEIQFQAGVLSGLFVLVRVCLLPMSWRDRAGRVLVCLAAHLIGLLGAAAAIVPFGEQMLASADWHEATRARESMLPSIALLGALAPDHFGRPRAGRFYQGPEDYVEAGLYFGLVPLLLALTACTRLLQPRRTLAGPAGHAVVIFAPWVLVCGTVVFGVPGVQELLRHLPLFSKADNMRLTLGVQFGGAMIAGAAWTQLNQGAERLVARILLAVSLAAAAILAALLFLPGQYGLYPHWQGLYQLWTDPTVPAPLEHRSLRTVVSLGVAVLSVLWAGAVARSLRRWPGREFPLGVHGMLVLLTVADLVWVAYGFNPIVPARVVFPEAPPMLRRVAEHLDDGRLIATDLILAPNVAMVYRLRDLRGYDFPLDRRWSRLFARLGWGKGGGIKLLPRDQVFPCVPPEVQSVCNKCCVRFLYTSSERMVGEPPETLPLCHGDKIDHDSLPAWSLVIRGVGAATDLVYQNPSAYPRAYFARRVTGTSPDRALEAVLDVSHDFREESFVEDQVGSVAIEADAGSQGEATIEYDGAEEVRIRTRSRAAALLVLSDRFDPNWRVQIDGRPAQALRANYLFRGVAVPAGEHSVRWTYRPVSFVWGCTISVLTVAVLLTSVLFGLIPRRAT